MNRKNGKTPTNTTSRATISRARPSNSRVRPVFVRFSPLPAIFSRPQFPRSSKTGRNMAGPGLTVVAAAIVLVADAVGSDPLASAHGRLVFSTLLYRHGDRSIEKTYPSDPYANESYWPMGLGQLIPRGIERQFELGEWLRKRHDGWLPRTYRVENVYVRSSDTDRTIISAQANLAGLYPPVGPRNWNGAPGERVQLVPVHTVPRSQDNVVSMNMAACPVVSREIDELADNNLELKQFYARFGSVAEYIAKHADVEMDSVQKQISNYLDLYYSLLIESQFNYTLPEWTESIFPEPLTTIAEKCFAVPTYNTVLKRLKAGPLLKEIMTRMREKENGTLSPDRMMWIYSAHDMTMISLLNAMGLYNGTIVPYSAVLMIELRLNATGNHVVTISYRNSSDHEPYLLRVPGCDSAACQLDRLTDVLSPVTPVDWNAECQIKRESHFWRSSIHFIGLSLVAVILILLSYVTAAKIVHCFQRQTSYQAY